MSLHEKSTHRSLVKTQSRDTQQACRLYPSLPDPDKYEICLPFTSTHDIHPPAQFKDIKSEENDEVSLKADILLLKRQRNELLAINKKWAKEYRTMVQYYKEKIQVLKASQSRDHPEDDTSDGEKPVALCENLKVKKEAESEETSELQTAQKEAKDLQVLNLTLTRRGQHQHKEIQRLNKALEEALQTTQPLEECGETIQNIWKHQAELYKEDFLRERKDREKLKVKFTELESRFRKVHDELRSLKSQVTWKQPVHRCSCTDQSKCPNWEAGAANHQRYKTDNKH